MALVGPLLISSMKSAVGILFRYGCSSCVADRIRRWPYASGQAGRPDGLPIVQGATRATTVLDQSVVVGSPRPSACYFTASPAAWCAAHAPPPLRQKGGVVALGAPEGPMGRGQQPVLGGASASVSPRTSARPHAASTDGHFLLVFAAQAPQIW